MQSAHFSYSAGAGGSGTTLNSRDASRRAGSQHLCFGVISWGQNQKFLRRKEGLPWVMSLSYPSIPGPLENTYRDFWLMVWEQKVLVIVMTTRWVLPLSLLCTLPPACPQAWGIQEGSLARTMRIRKATAKSLRCFSFFLVDPELT